MGKDQVIDLGEVNNVAANSAFWALRAMAIQSYAMLEQSLFSMFEMLTGMDTDTAGIIFFKITNTQARNKILEKLFKKRFEKEFNLFWNSILDQMRPIDMRRNEIVHWNTMLHISDGSFANLSLVRPAGWNQNTPVIFAADMEEFRSKCHFYVRLINHFTLIVMRRVEPAMPVDEQKTWLEIFSRPVTYPPPADHPLLRKPQAPDSQPQPSPA